MAQNSKVIQKVFPYYIDYPFMADYSITFNSKQILIIFATEEELKKIKEIAER
jgi:hypothetical protein